VEKRIVDSLKAGNTVRQAAAAASVSTATFMAWKARGRRGEPRYVEFLEHCEKAEAEAEGEAVKIVRDAALDGTWQAAAWWLERRRWRQWCRRDAPQRMPMDAEKMSDEELLKAIDTERASVLARLEAKKA